MTTELYCYARLLVSFALPSLCSCCKMKKICTPEIAGWFGYILLIHFLFGLKVVRWFCHHLSSYGLNFFVYTFGAVSGTSLLCWQNALTFKYELKTVKTLLSLIFSFVCLVFQYAANLSIVYVSYSASMVNKSHTKNIWRIRAIPITNEPCSYQWIPA